MWVGKQSDNQDQSAIGVAREHLLADMPVGYIYIDGSHTATISQNLPDLLNAPSSQQTLDACIQSLPAEVGDSLRHWVDSLTQNKQAPSHTFEIEPEGENKPNKLIQCTGHCLTPTDGGAESFIIWLYDLTSSQQQISRLTYVNNQLKDDVKRYSTILNMAPFPVWERDRDLNLRFCNLKYSELVEDIAERSEKAIPDIDKKHRQLASKAWDSGRALQDRRHVVVGDGERRFYQLEEYPVLDQDMSVGFGYDMSELETLQEELNRYVSAQADFLESSTSAMAIYGSNQRLQSFNAAFVNLWKLDESWLNTEPTYSEVLEALRENRMLPEQANFKQFKEQQVKLFTELMEPGEEFFYLPDGRTLRVLAITNAHGGVLFAYEDVTDRLALERSHNTLIAVQKETLDNLHEGVVVFGEDGRLRLCNPMYLSMWNIPSEMAESGPHLRDIINYSKELYIYDDWDEFVEQRISFLQSRKRANYRIECRDGKVMDCATVPLPDGATLISFIDVTDSTLVERSLRERNDALQEADRLKTEFLANVSYELRSPLTTISGFADMLQQDYVGQLSERQREYVDTIQEASNQLMDLVNDILDLASIEAGFMQLKTVPLDVKRVLSLAKEAVIDRIERHQLKLEFHCPDTLPSIDGDAFRLKQCLVNLLSNAIRFSSKGQTLTLGAEAIEDEIYLYVQDEGPGIPEEELPRIFNKFYKGKNVALPKTDGKSGTGLGLSMVKNFIELHGGRVEVDSEPGRTRFTCVLPLEVNHD